VKQLKYKQPAIKLAKKHWAPFSNLSGVIL